MANLEFCDKHNMVAYLKKRTGSEGFQEIVDFLNGSHIRHLQLANADGISVLPNTKIFDQLTLMGLTDDKLTFQKEEGEGSGNPSEPQPPPSTAQPTHKEPIPNIESSSPQKTQSPRQSLNKDTELPQTSVLIPNVLDEAVHQEKGDSVERAATTATSLEAMQDSSNIAKTRSMATPTELISQETSSDGGPRSQKTMGVLLFKLGIDGFIYKLSDRVLALETDLRQTKKVYGTAYTKFIMKVKKLEKTVKTSQARRRANIVVSVDDIASEDSSKQGRMIEEIDQDVGVTLVTLTKVSSQEDQPEDQLGVLSIAKLGEEESQRIARDVEVAQRLEEEIDTAEKQRMTQVHQAAQGFTEDDWEDIRARV
ncbi:hypothetical protein Tco_0539834 [Tanacetum coccineum]